MKMKFSGGFTLMEMLVYIFGLTLIMNLAFSAYFRCQKNTSSLRNFSNELLTTLNAGEQWREDVRNAISAPYLSNETDLCIPIASGKIIYTASNGKLWRQDAGHENKIQILKNVKNSIMQKELDSHVPAWKWELELLPSNPAVKPSHSFTFQAVTGFTHEKKS
jgi:hypothetical protein